MCFSAPASFALSGILTGFGAASIKQSSSRSRRLFAAIPLLFAAQQAAEGIVWLTVGGDPESGVLRMPFLVSSAQLARTIALAIVLSLTLTALIEQNALTSVWCFFAAMLSVLMLVAVRREEGTVQVAHVERIAPARP